MRLQRRFIGSITGGRAQGALFYGRSETWTDSYQSEDKGKPICAGREDSLERLMESGVQFAEKGEDMEEQTITSLLLECALKLLTPVERELGSGWVLPRPP